MSGRPESPPPLLRAVPDPGTAGARLPVTHAPEGVEPGSELLAALQAAEERAEAIANRLADVRLGLEESEPSLPAAAPSSTRFPMPAGSSEPVSVRSSWPCSASRCGRAVDYPLRVTSDTPTFLALVRDMAERPFASQSPFLEGGGGTQHATPYMQLLAFLSASSGRRRRLPDRPRAIPRPRRDRGLRPRAGMRLYLHPTPRGIERGLGVDSCASRSPRTAACHLGVRPLVPRRAVRELLPPDARYVRPAPDAPGPRAAVAPRTCSVMRTGSRDHARPPLHRGSARGRRNCRSLPSGGEARPGSDPDADRPGDAVPRRVSLARLLARPRLRRDGAARSRLHQPLRVRPVRDVSRRPVRCDGAPRRSRVPARASARNGRDGASTRGRRRRGSCRDRTLGADARSIASRGVGPARDLLGRRPLALAPAPRDRRCRPVGTRASRTTRPRRAGGLVHRLLRDRRLGAIGLPFPVWYRSSSCARSRSPSASQRSSQADGGR